MPSSVTSPSYLVCRIGGDFARLGSKPCPTGFGVSLHTVLTSDLWKNALKNLGIVQSMKSPPHWGSSLALT